MNPKFDIKFDDVAALITSLWNFFRNVYDWSSWYGVLTICLAIFFAFVIVAWILEKSVAIIFRCIGTFQEKILPIFSSQDERDEIGQRQMFCGLLKADLVKIGSGENWMDQWFTDLEAEVEVEGGIFVNRFDRWRNKSTATLRREPSLMAAITKSSEPRLLLVGDPGGGKSVALRHLALQMAVLGEMSSGRDIPVPLYINLREFVTDDSNTVNADTIREFVRTHVRRGDSNSSQYIQEYWDEYYMKGNWYFIFDSFDEIPEVLHAENGSLKIEKYSEAIRQFMEGMGKCRGILASREFKGPGKLPWDKLRILPLDNERQLRLIQKSSLSSELRSIAYSQLAAPHSAIYKNPMFLTLLCKHIKDNKREPEHSYDLLTKHLDKLSRRDMENVKKSYKLEPEDLMYGATVIAKIFAQSAEMSLAPTFSELSIKLAGEGYEEEQVNNLLNALVYVKIGRNDVPEAQQGDRRFAFAHRRYQECLFVKYLLKNPSLITPRELLLNSRWREYSVALLQSQDIPTCQPLLDSATELVLEFKNEQDNMIASEYAVDQEYFFWKKEAEVHVLNLLQEGLYQRVDEIPEALSHAVEEFISDRWENGDCYDRLKAIELGGLVPDDRLTVRLAEALESRVDVLLRASFAKVSFLKNVSEDLATWVRKRVADETFVASNLVELSRLDMLVSRLPERIGARRVFERNRFLRKIFYVNLQFSIDALVKISRVMNISAGLVAREDQEARVDLTNMFGMSMALATFVAALLTLVTPSGLGLKILAVVFLFAGAATICTLFLRDSPESITTFGVLARSCRMLYSVLIAICRMRLIPFIVFVFIPSMIFAISIYFHVGLYLCAAILSLFFTFGFGLSIWKMYQSGISVRRLIVTLKDRNLSNKVFQARTNAELFHWLSLKPGSLLDSVSVSRSLLKLLDGSEGTLLPQLTALPFFRKGFEGRKVLPRHQNLIVRHILEMGPD